MIAGIITTPNRQQYLTGLVPQISPFVDKLTIFCDTKRQGHTFNLRRCMKELLEGAGKDEPVLIMMDDVTTVPDWFDRYHRLQEQVPSDIYVFFTRRPHLIKYEQQGYFKGSPARGFYDHAVIYKNQHALIQRIDQWFELRGKQVIKPEHRQRHYDVVIQEFLIDNKIEWVTTIPCLFEHIGEVSTLGHDIGKAISFIGDK